MIIVSISDTHGLHWGLDIPDGDVLIHAGDITLAGTIDQVKDFDRFLGSLPHSHKIVIAGNHDFCFERDREASSAQLTNCIYLQDEEVQVQGVRFYGSPWQPWFFDWAFNLKRGPEIREKWNLIPRGTDVLITHGPPFGHGDLTMRREAAGCKNLLEVVEGIKPQIHIFGHIHEGAGVTENGETVFINASTCDSEYRPVNRPIVYTYEV